MNGCFLIRLVHKKLTVPPVAEIGSKAVDFSLPDARSGEIISLESFADARTFVLIFVSTTCPFSNAYNQVMADLSSRYQASNVIFLGINSNKYEPASEVAKHTKKTVLDSMS